MDAAGQGYLEIVEILLAAGADPSLTIAGTWTAFDFAVQNGQLPVVERLLRAAPRPTPAQLRRALLTAARAGHPRTAASLVAAGGDINAVDERGMTPLALAAKWGYPQTTRQLLELGGEVARADLMGRTPLMWAAWQGHGAVVDLLLAAGADSARQDRVGDSAFLGATSPDAIATLLAGHAGGIEPTPQACPTLVGEGLIYHPEGGLRITGYGLTSRPETGSSAWLIPHAGGQPLALRVTETRASEYPEDTWDADFETPPTAALAAGGAIQQYATLLWAPPETTPVRVSPSRADLPWGLFPETLRTAVDLDGDGRPDALDVEFCCGDTTSNQGCEYYCGEYWLKDRDGWRKCEAWNPA
jgi:hypothetical protein